MAAGVFPKRRGRFDSRARSAALSRPFARANSGDRDGDKSRNPPQGQARHQDRQRRGGGDGGPQPAKSFFGRSPDPGREGQADEKAGDGGQKNKSMGEESPKAVRVVRKSGGSGAHPSAPESPAKKSAGPENRSELLAVYHRLLSGDSKALRASRARASCRAVVSIFCNWQPHVDPFQASRRDWFIPALNV